MKAGDTVRAQELNRVAEALRGGWGPEADNMFRDEVLRRSGQEVTSAGVQLPQPWKAAARAEQTELVPLSVLKGMREFDRAATAPERVQTLAADIQKNGIQEPLMVVYDVKSGRAMLGEGNHRIAAAEQLGLDSLPVRVARVGDGSLAEKGVDVAGTSRAADLRPSDIGLQTAQDLSNPDLERAARYFSEYLNKVTPELTSHDVMRQIAKSIPMDGASPADMTQAMLLNNLLDGFKGAETDAFRLAMINPNRNVLERSLNHPMFGIYPSSFMWGKVLPETFKFIAYNPFGVKTMSMLETYYKVQQAVALQSQYDPQMKDVWDRTGRNGVMTLLSYLTPSMPWDDMKGNLPPWARDVVHGNPGGIIPDQLSMMGTDRWWDRGAKAFDETQKELGKDAAGLTAPSVASEPGAITPQQSQQLQGLSGVTPQTSTPATPGPTSAATKGAALAPTLQGDLAQLERILMGK